MTEQFTLGFSLVLAQSAIFATETDLQSNKACGFINDFEVGPQLNLIDNETNLARTYIDNTGSIVKASDSIYSYIA